MTELQHQQAVIKWSQQPTIRAKYPELKLLYHIPNERYCSPAQGKQLKLAGVKRGVPDMDLPVARRGYNGLRIELKTEKGQVSRDQKWWIEQLKQQGYCVAVCRGWKQAVEVIEWYLGDDSQAKNPRGLRQKAEMEG